MVRPSHRRIHLNRLSQQPGPALTAPGVHRNAQLSLTKRSFIARSPRQRSLPPGALTRISHSKLRGQPNNRRLSTLSHRHRITPIHNALSLQHFAQIGVWSSNRKSLTHRPQYPATKKLNSTPERSLLWATGISKKTGSGETAEAGSSTKTEDLADVITRAARRAGDLTAGKSSTTNRLITFRMLAYGPPAGNLGAPTAPWHWWVVDREPQPRRIAEMGRRPELP